MISVESCSYDTDDLRRMIAHYVGDERVPRRIRLMEDTSDFFRIEYDDVVLLGGRPYLMRNNQKEGRFGIDDEPKFWVRKAIDLVDGSEKIIKMVFHERYNANIGGIVFDCVRSPQKEARILGKVAGNERFMQGFAAKDSAGNIIRVLDYIRGVNFSAHVLSLNKGHEKYYHTNLREVIDEFIALVQAIGFLHGCNEKHGDIRRDHIIMDSNTGKGRWIDFDYTFLNAQNRFGYDLFGLGNILTFVVAGGDVTVQTLQTNNPQLLQRLSEDDMNIVFQNRLVNLRKVYPYVADALNLVLLHFSNGANVFYDTVAEFLEDLLEARDKLT
ncbi:MAG: hypothetical protein HQL05_05735 [Nitrospirae bacterium]|uniref:hypothetical protein n=1 Tax=Candidatus Magnetobacterium casense TaxID=1455061 RepID=UPI000697CF6F|nr:hypothetical protein [Candidatus Magnetobacterium casensis]MBF0337315.1 hypothetical protein [Nitrospirota bacterium]